MTRPSKRQIERTVDDLGTGTDEKDTYAERRENARVRWERDDYEAGAKGDIQRLWDAYALAYEDRNDWFRALGSDFEYLGDANLEFKTYSSEEFDKTLPEVPEVPTEEVAEALIEYGKPYVDGDALRERHGAAWVRRFVEEWYYEQTRARCEGSNLVWDPGKVESDIRRWREMYREQYGPAE